MTLNQELEIDPVKKETLKQALLPLIKETGIGLKALKLDLKDSISIMDTDSLLGESISYKTWLFIKTLLETAVEILEELEEK